MKQYQSVIKRLLPFLTRRRGATICIVALSLFTVVLNLYVPILIGESLDALKGMHNVDTKRLFLLLGILAIVVVGTAFTQWIVSVISNEMAYEIAEEMRKKAFMQMQALPISYLDTHQSGDLMNRIISDITLVSDGLLLGITQLIIGAFTILGTVGFMVSIHLKIALVVVILTPISLLVASYIAKKTFHFFTNQTVLRAKMGAITEEMIGNAKLVQAFSYEERAIARVEKVNEELRVCGNKALFFSALTNPTTRVVNNLIYATVCIYGAFTVLSGGMSVGQLIGFLQYANQYTKPFNEISAVLAEFTNALAGARRIFEFLDESVEVELGEERKEKLGARGEERIEEKVREEKVREESEEVEEEIEEAQEEIEMKVVKQDVKIENLAFSYTKEKQILKNITMHVHSGQRVALVGPSGCGKTTIINLMMRFYDSTQGEIYIGGQNSKCISKQSLRQSMGMVLQDTWLKSGTVHENIAYGKPHATREEVVNAAKNANAHSFIHRLPNGYDTQICEDGGNLSKGQQQLLCIARVMLIEPAILLLDEATSSIDTRTERKVSESFDKLMVGRTSLVIAHRLSTIQEADIILVMNKGHIVERGTHEELLAKQGFYANMYQSQS